MERGREGGREGRKELRLLLFLVLVEGEVIAPDVRHHSLLLLTQRHVLIDHKALLLLLVLHQGRKHVLFESKGREGGREREREGRVSSKPRVF